MKSVMLSGLVAAVSLSMAACTARPPIEVINTDTQEVVSLTPNQARDAEARVCTKEKIVGTRFPVTQCTTQEERDARRRQAQEDHDQRQRRTQIPGF
ncbi:hypothetical protein [Nevskia sp.]|uniref:hypothetical protein n=1 Tax=Nevskia sp. TaxID=1929292 RepID=UPI0025F5F304|nr:hypothetical protein [Nevskia sp.]